MGTMISMTKQDALVALATEGLIAVEHPDGPVQAPGGGYTDWPAVAAIVLCPRVAVARPHGIVGELQAWNQAVGTFIPSSWEPTRVSIMNAVTGHVVASCELNDEDALIHAVLTVISRPRRH